MQRVTAVPTIEIREAGVRQDPQRGGSRSRRRTEAPMQPSGRSLPRRSRQIRLPARISRRSSTTARRSVLAQDRLGSAFNAIGVGRFDAGYSSARQKFCLAVMNDYSTSSAPNHVSCLGFGFGLCFCASVARAVSVCRGHDWRRRAARQSHDSSLYSSPSNDAEVSVTDQLRVGSCSLAQAWAWSSNSSARDGSHRVAESNHLAAGWRREHPDR